MAVLHAWLRDRKLPLGVAWLVIALAYVVLGIASLKLAIPPVLAAICMPSVGMSLAALMMGGYRMAPGVWLGASILMLWMAEQLLGVFSKQIAVSSVFSGLAAMIQVMVGLFLIRRVVGHRPKLQSLREIFWMLVLGGPVACVINASFSTPMLVLSGVLTPSEGPHFWRIMWACDTLGVLVMLPITLAIVDWPRGAWAGRRVLTLVTMVACLMGSLALFSSLARWGRTLPEHELSSRAEADLQSIQAQLERGLRFPLIASRFMETTDSRRAELFHRFMEVHREEVPSLWWIAWAPRDASTVGATVYPVAFVEPPQLAESLAGVNLVSEPTLRQGVLEMLKRQTPTVSHPRPLLGTPQGSRATLMLMPTREAPGAGPGVLAMALDLQPLTEAILAPFQTSALHFTIWDVTEPEEAQQLGGGALPVALDPVPMRRSLMTMGGRQWEIRAHSLPGKRYPFPHQQLWRIMVFCLLFTGLLAVLLVYQGGEKARVAALVAERTETLHQRELFLSAVLQSALDGLLTLDAGGRVLSANQAACQLLGRPVAEWEGLALTEVLPGLDWASLRAELDGQPRESLGLRREAQARHRDGREVPVELALSNASNGGKSTYVLLLHDVSERARVVKMKDEFISTVSHELRTPLTSILGSLSLINHGGKGKLADMTPKLLTIAENNAQRLLALINDLLDVDKMEAGKLSLECKPTELGPVLVRSLEENRGYAERFQVSLHLEPGTGAGVWASLDGNRFAQVMSNLLSNAIKFSPSGSRVEVGMVVEPAWVEVSVRDQGDGIPPEFQAQLFRKFSQADSSDTRRQPGTGLGLYLTRMLVEGMHGTLRFQSALGQGTTFFVHLPRVDPVRPT